MPGASNADIAKIPGWFARPDIDLFRLLLESSRADGGDLAEIGVYLGRSSVLLGSYLQPGESLTVVDTFGGEVDDEENQRENDEQYVTLSRAAFEENYRAVHGSLPTVVQGLSSTLPSHAAHGSHRFLHIDGSHMYEHVVSDLASARILLKPEGVVVLDDYRAAHTPGVAAAAWQAVSNGLRPFAVTGAKMYATWGDAPSWLSTVTNWLHHEGHSFQHEIQSVGSERIVRIWSESKGRSKFVPPVLLPVVSRAYERFMISRS